MFAARGAHPQPRPPRMPPRPIDGRRSRADIRLASSITQGSIRSSPRNIMIIATSDQSIRSTTSCDIITAGIIYTQASTCTTGGAPHDLYSTSGHPHRSGNGRPDIRARHSHVTLMRQTFTRSQPIHTARHCPFIFKTPRNGRTCHIITRGAHAQIHSQEAERGREREREGAQAHA